ncbi:MAG: hypothetical protein NTV86_20215 [Planctomycetota bacterium]|nr:hypothetical protein [Planctomycetota bacterium]
MKEIAEVKPDRLPQAPLWVLSFADMITNLMAAFVMLQAFASATPTAASFKAGQGSFKRAIKNFGLPSWAGWSIAITRRRRGRKKSRRTRWKSRIRPTTSGSSTPKGTN